MVANGSASKQSLFILYCGIEANLIIKGYIISLIKHFRLSFSFLLQIEHNATINDYCEDLGIWCLVS